jgi:hypothetical protein
MVILKRRAQRDSAKKTSKFGLNGSVIHVLLVYGLKFAGR